MTGMPVPLDEALAPFSQAERMLAAAALDTIASAPGATPLARSVADILTILAAHLRTAGAPAP